MSSLFLLAHIHKEFEDLTHILGVEVESLGALLDALQNALFALWVAHGHAALFLDTRYALSHVRPPCYALNYFGVYLLYLFAEFL